MLLEVLERFAVARALEEMGELWVNRARQGRRKLIDSLGYGAQPLDVLLWALPAEFIRDNPEPLAEGSS